MRLFVSLVKTVVSFVFKVIFNTKDTRDPPRSQRKNIVISETFLKFPSSALKPPLKYFSKLLI